MKSRYVCPSCKKPLIVERGGEFMFGIHCGHGPCRSTKANDGAEADTEKRAFEILRKNIEAEFENVTDED